ncbi:MAG: hypothetical protein MUC87_06260 [Bacteroidia bacterium]|jgi:hypothetical protein|nr:hypothetical protein [Bacteroidia bacterium]
MKKKVSTLELLVKRIASVNGVPSSVSAVFRRVVQGYFLSVANLENRRIRFQLTVVIPKALNAAGEPIREFVIGGAGTANQTVVFDVVGTAADPNGGQTSVGQLSLVATNAFNKVYQTPVYTLQAHQTGNLAILPDIGGNSTLAVNAALEIRGYVEIEQVRTSIFGNPAANILLTPEIRGTFLDNAWPTVNTTDELDFDQINYCLPTGNGGSAYTLDAVPSIILEDRFPIDIKQLQQLVGDDNEHLKKLKIPINISVTE